VKKKGEKGRKREKLYSLIWKSVWHGPKKAFKAVYTSQLKVEFHLRHVLYVRVRINEIKFYDLQRSKRKEAKGRK